MYEKGYKRLHPKLGRVLTAPEGKAVVLFACRSDFFRTSKIARVARYLAEDKRYVL